MINASYIMVKMYNCSGMKQLETKQTKSHKMHQIARHVQLYVDENYQQDWVVKYNPRYILDRSSNSRSNKISLNWNSRKSLDWSSYRNISSDANWLFVCRD